MCTHCCYSNVKFPSSHEQHTPTMSPVQSTILKSMISYVKIKVVIKFEASDQDLCRIKTQKAMKCVHIAVI